MQLTRGNFIEKILRNADGQLVRVTFALYEHEGRIKARVVDTVLIEDQKSDSEILALCGCSKIPAASLEISLGGATISPYATLNPLYVSGSQPRAPTLSF